MVEDLRFRDLVVIGSPSWSPDGGRIVFTAIDRAGANDLFLFDRGTQALSRLTNDVYDERDPAWSPDGRWIAFSSDRTSFGAAGTQNLFVLDATQGSIAYLTCGPGDDRAPAWSPDGRTLAFVSNRGGAQNVWVVRVDSGRAVSNAKRVTNFITAAFDPAWSGPNDLVITVFERFSFQIRMVRNVTALSDSGAMSAPAVAALPGDPWTPARLDGPQEIRKYRSHENYSIDVAQSQIGTDPVFGTTGGAVLAMSDLLGNEQYSFLIYNTASVQSELLDNFNVAISRASLGQRTNYAYGIFRFAGQRYDLTDPSLYYYERSFGGYVVLSYPLSKFQRVETGITVSNSEKDVFDAILPRRALLVSNSLSYVWDTSLWGPTGPLDGNRMAVKLAYTSDVEYSNVGYYTVIADVRDYERIGDLSAVAMRAQLWYNDGREARRFFMGGSWDLRGWDRWSIRGTKQWLMSAELRVPFVDQLVVRFPFGGIGFGPFRGAAFADIGGSWDDVYTDTKGSVGVGVRMSLAGVLVLRYDIGKRIEHDLTKLQNGLFYQFFFGWDF